MTPDALEITFINKSSAPDRVSVVIFQHNEVASVGEQPIAWQVIQQLGPDWSYTFEYAFEIAVGVVDGYGNASPRFGAGPGQRFTLASKGERDELRRADDAPDEGAEIGIENHLAFGAIGACAYRSGRLLACKMGLEPGQKAAFRFQPILRLCVVSWLKQGEILNPAIVSAADTQLSLAGLSGRATIVMTGGGPGVQAMPFIFTLEPG